MHSGSLLNRLVGEYRLVDFLGAGGMGEVYRGVHSKIGRVVAVKVLTARADRGLSERFINEARIQSKLHHRSIAALYDFAEVSGCPCIVMEYVAGQTLDEYVGARGRLAPREALAIFEQVVEAVGYVHQNAIIHRDIKSNNIKVGAGGAAKLLDFGIAKGEASPNLTLAGDVIGTLNYLSPEQLKGRPADARCDIWALGILLYEMVTGEFPFRAETAGALIEQIRSCDYVHASALDPSLPAGVESIITRCLKKNASHRYQNADQLLADVHDLRASLFTPPAEEREEQRERWSVPPLAIWLAASLGALVLAVTAIVYATAGDDTPRPVVQPAPTQVAQQVGNGTSRGELKSMVISTVDGAAEVWRDGHLVGTTPYTMTEPLGKTVYLTFKRKNFADKTLPVSVTENQRDFSIALEPEEKAP
ncbi:MAG: eukaryotic-like serine/threonine-protein kinase [Acidobacteriota bacterium]|nr:eukaryotic-like serine/threonine-protein kinase [Acidobacteriota bacterium]